MTDAEHILQEIRDDLSEAARYARADPGAACALIRRSILRLREAHLGAYLGRIADNLAVARHNIRADPTVAAGYAEGARFELGVIADAIRNRREAAERDRELADAFGGRAR